MKIRIGFVSNSSSASFCVAKNLMTPKQVNQFQDWLKKHQNNREDETDLMGEGWVLEHKYYFHGSIDINCYDIMRDFLLEIGVSPEVLACDC
jgi:hypothetical protein